MLSYLKYTPYNNKCTLYLAAVQKALYCLHFRMIAGAAATTDGPVHTAFVYVEAVAGAVALAASGAREVEVEVGLDVVPRVLPR